MFVSHKMDGYIFKVMEEKKKILKVVRKPDLHYIKYELIKAENDIERKAQSVDQ